jgi:outer membrane protein OmpA-like peptidoglycan-associated protein
MTFFRQGMLKPMLKRAIALSCGWVLAAVPAQAGSSAATGVRLAPAPGQTAEMHLPADQDFTLWGFDPDRPPDEGRDPDPALETAESEAPAYQETHRIMVCRTETVCQLRYKEGYAHRVRVKHLIAPLYYADPMAGVPDHFLQQVRLALINLRDKQNVVVRFIAHTDNAPLSEWNEGIYGNHDGLSKAVAHRVALAVRESLGPPEIATASEGRGAAQPVASNATQQGRALNRRVEVEFWHDDPLQDLPDEPQLCPDAAGAETVTRVYDPPVGRRRPDPVRQRPAGAAPRLHRAAGPDHGRDQRQGQRPPAFCRLHGNQRLDRRTAAVYGDDIGLSMARARRAMAAVSDRMGLTGSRRSSTAAVMSSPRTW